jgi:dipeptidyl aminopeptidase/acylaminoacyl peptidase
MPRLVLIGLVCMTAAVASGQTPYRQPPKPVVDILDVPPPPAVSVSPTRDMLALVQSSRYPTIADLAEPMLRLAGLRINPKTNGPARQPRVTGISFLPVAGGEPRAVTVPAGAKLGAPVWSPDGKRFAVTNTTAAGIELWVGNVATATLDRKLTDRLSGVSGDPFQWLDGDRLLVQVVPAGRGEAPPAPPAPAGPTVQESGGKAAPVRTYQDLLKDAHDEALFDHYATSQLMLVNLSHSGRGLMPVGKPAVFANAEPSPDGRFVLVSRLKRPYSYLYPASSFPRAVEVWDIAGNVVRSVADLPLQDKVPIGGVPTGPRSIGWVPTAPAELVWAEALDGGNPKAKVSHRDELFTLAAPFSGDPTPAGKTQHRFAGLSFFEAGNKVLLRDFDRDRRWSRTAVTTLAADAGRAVIFDRSINDRYNDPGTPLTKTLPNGQRVLRTTPDGKLLLISNGSTPKGDFPTLNAFDPGSKQVTPVFKSRDGMYEQVAAVLDDEGKTLLVRRESPTDPGNYFLRAGDKETQLTFNKDPYPELRSVSKQLVTTKRADGVTISFTLYLPPGHKAGEKLPTVFWAYPREFNDPGTAGQVTGSPNRFVTLTGYSHLFFLTQGYAVMDEVSMPVVGPVDSANDTFVEQLVMNAKAAIDKAAELGPIDRDRIGIGGHSYGAFMTANLLAHSDLFRAGIARSGAYNRTLTPFGFQNEERTFWQAPQVYARMSPFNSADKINEPLLLIHGQADSNPGTFPVQSERMYAAVRGNGGTVRLVLLPHEDHGYAARESVGHVLAEQIDWFDKHVKNAKPRNNR